MTFLGSTSASGTTAAIAAHVDSSLLLTRDGTTKEVVAYLNGIEQFRFIDSADRCLGNPAHFFLDNTVPPFTGETSPGEVHRIRVFDAPFSPAANAQPHQQLQHHRLGFQS